VTGARSVVCLSDSCRAACATLCLLGSRTSCLARMTSVTGCQHNERWSGCLIDVGKVEVEGEAVIGRRMWLEKRGKGLHWQTAKGRGEAGAESGGFLNVRNSIWLPSSCFQHYDSSICRLQITHWCTMTAENTVLAHAVVSCRRCGITSPPRSNNHG